MTRGDPELHRSGRKGVGDRIGVLSKWLFETPSERHQVAERAGVAVASVALAGSRSREVRGAGGRGAGEGPGSGRSLLPGPPALHVSGREGARSLSRSLAPLLLPPPRPPTARASGRAVCSPHSSTKSGQEVADRPQ